MASKKLVGSDVVKKPQNLVSPSKNPLQLVEKDTRKKQKKLIGSPPSKITKPLIGSRPEPESNVITLPTSIQPASIGPLSAPVIAASLGCKGLRIQAARRKNLYDNRPSMVGMRTIFNIDFYDTNTKQAVSPTNVKVVVSIGSTTVTITLVETTGRIGHYTGSFIPAEPGEWNAIAKYGSPPESVDSKEFYVLPAS